MLRFSILTLLVVLFWTAGIFAAEWEYIYEGNNLPDDPALGDKVWNVFKTAGMNVSEVAEITPDGELHIVDPNDKVSFFMRDIDVNEATVEARVKVLSQSGVAYSLLVGIEDGGSDAWLDLFPDRVSIHNGGASHNIDMKEYHTLRVTRDRKNNMIVYVDDEKVLEGKSAGNSGRKDIIFGAGSTGGTSESYWDYVVYTTAGAFSPEELPNYMATLAVDVAGKLPVRWGGLKAR